MAQPGSGLSATHTIIVLAAAPTITSPAANAVMDVADPTIHGSGAFAGEIVHGVRSDGADMAGQADANGNFTLTGLGSVSEGAHTITIDNVDDNGESGPSASRTFYSAAPGHARRGAQSADQPRRRCGVGRLLGRQVGRDGTAVRSWQRDAGRHRDGRHWRVRHAVDQLRLRPTDLITTSATQDDNAGHVEQHAPGPSYVDIDTVAPGYHRRSSPRPTGS